MSGDHGPRFPEVFWSGYEIIVSNLERERSGQHRFSIDQARQLARALTATADAAAAEVFRQQEEQRIAALPPVDRTQLDTTSGAPVDEVRAGQTNTTGQHDAYIVLSAAERAKGFVRPYRDRYQHKACGGVTSMGRSLSETYARDPTFYGLTFCVGCNAHFPVREFVWIAGGQVVGS